jgi:uncharacterized damage-inducible protein DinB
MTRVIRIFAFTAVALALAVANSSAQAPATLKGDFLKEWASQKDTLVKIAEAMPEAKYSFKPTPAQRDFGGQVMHVAQVNVAVFKMLNPKAAAPVINEKAATKAEMIKAMADSFDYGTAVLNEQTEQSMAASIPGPPWMGPSTRARIVAFMIGHTQDIYGQMVVYLRLSGGVPPASQRP